MDRQIFKTKMEGLMKKTTQPLTLSEQLEIMNKSIEVLAEKHPQDSKGFHNLIIVMEELAELTQEISKVLRHKMDFDGVLEELADVSIGVDYVKEILDITDKELEYARSIKIEELRNKLSKDNYS